MKRCVWSSIWAALAIIPLMVLVACGDEAGSGAESLSGTEWSLVTVQGMEVLDGTSVTMLFAEDGQLTGSGGCNRYNGTWEAGDDDALTLDAGAMTLMGCDEPIITQEQAFTGALAAAASFRLDDDTLSLRDAEGNELATFAKFEPADLTGTEWTATAYNTGQQAVSSLVDGTTITALFGDDETLTGNAGCNTYNTSYAVDGDTISIEPAATTRMACDQPVMDQETAYLAALGQAATVELGADTLNLRAADGSLLVSYIAVE